MTVMRQWTFPRSPEREGGETGDGRRQDDEEAKLE